MPRLQFAVTQIVRAGVNKPAVVAGDPTNDHYIPSNNARIFLEAKNIDATDRSIVFETPLLTDSLAVADLTVSVPPGQTWMIGPFSAQTFNQLSPADSIYVNVDVSLWEFRAFQL